MIRFSVVTITYNAAAVLQRTLDSMLLQSWEHVEHLIVDGVSKDQTVKIAEDYRKVAMERHPEWTVKIQSEPDKGLYDAMNKGLAMATGDYILFLNAGDCLPAADTLQKVRDAIGQTRPAVVYGDTNVVDEKGQFLHRRRLSPPEHLSWRSFRKGMLVCHQAFYARTDIAQPFPYDLQYRYSADVDWCIRVMKAAEEKNLSLVNTHTVLVNYLKEGQTTLHHRDSLKERFRVMRKHYGLFTTLMMHAWFVVRAIIKKVKK